MDILCTEVPVKLVVKIGVMTEEERSKADEYNIPVSQLLCVDIDILILFIYLINIFR